jgi:hypothetical protein
VQRRRRSRVGSIPVGNQPKDVRRKGHARKKNRKTLKCTAEEVVAKQS